MPKDGIKNLGVIVTIGLALAAGLVGYGKLVANAGETRKKVEKIDEEYKEKIEKNKDRIVENEKFDVKQSTLIESSLKIIDKLEKKLDK